MSDEEIPTPSLPQNATDAAGAAVADMGSDEREENAAEDAAPEETSGDAERENAEDSPTEAHERRPLDTGVLISMICGLLRQMEESGNDFRDLSARAIDDATFEDMCQRAQAREEDNDRVFGGEKDALCALRAISDEELATQIHKKSRDYSRRASTSNKVALALSDSYDNSLEPGADPNILNPKRLRKQLKELLGVVVSLSEQRSGLVEFITSSKEHFEELISSRYHDRTETLLAEFDVLKMEHEGLSKMRFKRRAALREEMATKLEELEKINGEYAEYAFVDVQTRELPES